MTHAMECYIFGAGKWGAGFYKKIENDPTYVVKGFIDNNPQRRGQIYCGQRIFLPSDIADKDTLIVIATGYFRLITQQLKSLGFTHVQSCIICGEWETDTDYSYVLFDADSATVFGQCVPDLAQAARIRADFQLNYSADHLIELQSDASATARTDQRKTVLFIAYLFPPIGGSGVQRSIKFVKYLVRMGYRVIVLTVGQYFDATSPQDRSLLQDIPDEVEIIRIDERYAAYSQLSQRERQEIYNLFLGNLLDSEWLPQFLASAAPTGELVPQLPYEHYIWTNECLKHVAQLIDFSSIDVLYTTASPFADFMLGYYLKQKYHIPWVMDYRDPWASDDHHWRFFSGPWGDDVRPMLQAIERETIKAADAVVTVAASVQADIQDVYGLEGVLARQIVNGYDEDDFAVLAASADGSNARTGVFTICHNGNIYGNEDLSELVKILNQLIADRRIDQQRIRIVVNGTIEYALDAAVLAQDTYGLVERRGRLSHMDSLQSAQQSDLLLLLLSRGGAARDAIAGKLFEYVRLGVPVLAFSSRGSAAEQVLRQTRTGSNFAYEDTQAVADYIAARYEDWLRGQTNFAPDNEAIRQYSRETETRQLIGVFEQCMAKGK